MNPRSALLDGRARVYAGGEACSAISLRAGLKQYSKLMYGLTTLIKAGYDSGKGMEMTEIPVREGIETVRRFGKSCEFNVLGNGELGVEGRAVTRVLMTGIEHWMGAGLGELQVGEFGYCYCRDFGEYEVCREGEEGCYGDYEGGHGKVVGGMGRVLDGILGKGGGKRVRCGCRVRGVEYGGEGGTKVTTDSGDLYTSSVVVCTVPLGVLKSGSITFSPPLPHRKVKAIDKIGVGTYKKVRMTFESVTWDPGPEVFMCCRMTAPGKVKREKERVLERGGLWVGDRILVYNQWARKGVPVLEAVLTGEAGEACWGREDGEVVDAVVRLVRMNMGRERIGEVVEATVTRWEEDELFMGAYSYYGLGSTTRDLEAMRERVGCEGSYLLFAGEHCDEEYQGSVHGAIHSGREAGEEAWKCLNGLEGERGRNDIVHSDSSEDEEEL